MKICLSSKLFKSSFGFIFFILILCGIVNAHELNNDFSGNKETHLTIIKAEVATGPNKFLDKPIRNHGFVFGWPMRTLGFSELGEYNPNGTDPLPLTSETDLDAILATFVDPEFAKTIGFDPGDLDPSFINVPIHKVKTLTEIRTQTGVKIERASLPGMFDSNPFQASIAAPNKPITLGDWVKAKGTAIIECDREGHSVITIRVRNLIPNRVYTVWSANVSAELGPFNQTLGGAPSVIMTDENGNGRFKRELNFCLLGPVDEVQAQMLWIMVVLHSDHMAYGGVFTTNEDSLFGGTVAHVHLHIPLTGDPVK